MALLDLGELEAAARQFDEALALAPGYADAKINLDHAREWLRSHAVR